MKIDENGNYIIARVIINDTLKLLLINIYGPNTDSPSFYEEIGVACAEMGNDDTATILAGDLNMALNGDLDTVNYLHENNTRARDVLLRVMEENGLIDIFRERNGDLRRYSWRSSGTTVKQARLDYILISRSLITKVSDVNIVPGYRTDHSMVTLKLGAYGHNRARGFFKMNNSLLGCEDYCQVIRETILDTALTYALPVYAQDFVRKNSQGVEMYIRWSCFWEVLILNMRTATVSFAIRKEM